MRSHIYTYVKTCAKCNTNKTPRCRRQAELGHYYAGTPMDRVMMDIPGPLFKTPQGNTVILMLIDQFTKWIECYLLPDQSAELVTKAVVEDFFPGLESHGKSIRIRAGISSVTCSHHYVRFHKSGRPKDWLPFMFKWSNWVHELANFANAALLVREKYP